MINNITLYTETIYYYLNHIFSIINIVVFIFFLICMRISLLARNAIVVYGIMNPTTFEFVKLLFIIIIPILLSFIMYISLTKMHIS